MDIEAICYRVIGAAIEGHRNLGPGLLESAYEACLAQELRTQGINFECQKALPLTYKGLKLDAGYRLDLLVEGVLVVEVKSVDELCPIHTAQLLTYLKLMHLSLGLLVNFNAAALKDGLKRVVYNHPNSP